MNTAAIKQAVKSNKVLNSIIFFDNIDSTNACLKTNSFSSGTIAVAAEQTAGRGKHGAKWVSGKGGLWFSFVINKKVKRPYEYVILSSVAVCEALKAMKVKATVKWPNDILVDGKKICGMLIENDHYNSSLVTGIGINVNNTVPKDSAIKAVSLKTLLKRTVDMDKFFIAVLKRIDGYLEGMPGNKRVLVARWVKSQGDIKGREIKLNKNGKTVILTVDKVLKNGSVKVKNSKGKVKVIKGEVFFL